MAGAGTAEPQSDRQRPRDWQKALSLKPQPDDRIVARGRRTEILLVIHRLDTRKRRQIGGRTSRRVVFSR